MSLLEPVHSGHGTEEGRVPSVPKNVSNSFLGSDLSYLELRTFGYKVKQPVKEHMTSFQAIQCNYCRGCGKRSVCIIAVSPRKDHC